MSAAVVVLAFGLAGALAGRPRPARTVADPVVRRDRPSRRGSRRSPADDPVESLPDLVDLLTVAAAAGLPAAPAVVAVADRAPGAWRPPLLLALVADAERGRRVVDALDHLVAAHGGLARPLAGVLRAATDDGDALLPGLDRLATDARDLRRRRAEEAARRIPVRLLLPLVTCSLPAAAVLTVVPIVAGALDGLRFPS